MEEPAIVQANLGLELIQHAIKIARLAFAMVPCDAALFRDYTGYLSDIEESVFRAKDNIKERNSDG